MYPNTQRYALYHSLLNIPQLEMHFYRKSIIISKCLYYMIIITRLFFVRVYTYYFATYYHARRPG